MEVTIFGIDLTVDPVAFKIGDSWTVYWYGIIIALGFALAIVYGLRNAKRLGINVDKMLDVVLITTPVAILCARLYYLIFYQKGGFGFKEFFGIGTGSGFSGLAIYGGVIGAIVVGGITCLVMKINVFDIFDLASIGFLIGQGIGRWGNFINQEAFGGLTGSDFWGMQSANTIAECGEGMVHPCFLYESVWCLTGALLLHILSKRRKFSGQIGLGYCIWYGFGRTIIESLRTDSLMIGELKVSLLLSIVLCVGGAITMAVVYNRKKPEGQYVSVFSEEEEQDYIGETSEQIEESETIADVEKENGDGDSN